MIKRLLCLFMLPILLFAGGISAQVTSSTLSGNVKNESGTSLVGATITAKHEPTGSTYSTVSRSNGNFSLANMNPGGPYTITISYVGYANTVRPNVFLVLGDNANQTFVAQNAATELTGVTVAGVRRAAPTSKGGTETNISRERIDALPTVGRNITDYLRSVPQAKLGTTEGSITIAGQNNRYNAFYVDGAVNNDVFGLAASGTNGGQANVPPISIDALDQIQVMISPFDASFGNFTGGGINAITRSGTNKHEGSVYYLLRNQDLSGKTPTGPKSSATKIPDFKNQTYGFRVGGPIIKNKVFYFLNMEWQRDERPQPFDTSRYSGNTRPARALALADTLRSRYGYDPGEFINNAETVEANRIVAKIDWNISSRNKLSLSYRYNDGSRVNASSSSSTRINFFNNGFQFPSTNHSGTVELRSNFNKGASNRLLLTYTNVKDDRSPIGSPFPRVTINDGAGQIIFGPDNSSTVNLLTQKVYTLFDAFRFTKGKHNFSVGTDNELSDVYNAFIQNTYGNYTYANLDSFLLNRRPSNYQVGYPLIDNRTDETTTAAAKFKTLRMAVFANDEYKVNDKLTLNVGVRADLTQFLTTPATDTFTNNTAIPVFSQYYDLKGARSGQKPRIPVSISPRIGFTYKASSVGLTVRGGTGFFTGRIPLVWPGGIYNNNGIYQASYTATAAALNTIRFRPDPFNQYRASDFGATTTKGSLNLVSKDFKLPRVWRSSLAFDKVLGAGWTTTLEGSFTQNINETFYTDFALLPAIGVSKGPGPRTVYASNTAYIPIGGTTNPYGTDAMLLSNYDGKKGNSYNITFSVDKRFASGFTLNANYNYGRSTVVHEPTSSVNYSQWRFMETVNGRNNLNTTSYSDFDQGHRFFGYVSKKFTYAKNYLATTVSLVYTGQSGNRFSYTYSGNSAVRDVATGTNADLIYIPTAGEIATMTFLSNTIGNTTYTPAQQQAALNKYIEANPYLRARRGQFAERNGDRMPFTNILDLHIAQDFNVKVGGGRRVQFQVTYDVFNFTNLISRNWGRTYFISNDYFTPIDFAGYISNADLTPQYRFNPNLNQPQSPSNISTSTAPSFSARWTSQLGLRMTF